MEAGEFGCGSWRGGRVGQGPRVYTCFSCSKEGHFAANCPDKVTPKETPEINMISLTISINVVTRSQSKRMIEDASDLSATKAKGKQIVKDELAEQHQLAAKVNWRIC